MRKTLFFVLFFCVMLCAGHAQPQAQTYRKKLDQPTEIQGYPCAKGYAWFYHGGQLQKCTVTREMPFGEITIPAGSWITLLPDGNPWGVQMSHDAPMLGMVCEGGSFLGTGEASDVGVYPSGKLKVCYLASDQLVQGVPCAHGGFFASMSSVHPNVNFYESGKLKSCKLAKDYGSQRRGERFQQTP
jgi:hypothetical protein